jgi:hypothetical protein
MATAIQRRRGNTAQHASFTGLAGELTIDTDKNTVVVHDGVTAGGYPLARADEVEALGGADITAVIAGSGLTGGASSGNATISLDYENLSGNLIPSVDNTYSLGSPDKVWKDIFVGPGSLYIDGQKVLESDAGTIVFTADPAQNISVVTTGGADIELNTGADGSIQLKGNVVLNAGKTFTTAGGGAFTFTSNVTLDSNHINGVADPVQAQDAATKNYVDTDATVVRVTGAQSIAGNKTFSNDVVVSGNLTVSGTTTTVNSETISLADNIIDLNSNFTVGSPTENAGIKIKRGDEADVQIRWNEADNKWQFTNDGSSYVDMLTSAQVKALFSATDAGGDGSFSYSDGVFTYTGPSAAEVRAHFSAGTGVGLTNGEISIGQSVGTSDNVTFNQVTADLVGNADTATQLATARNITLAGDLSGSAAFDGSANISITATIASNSVELGADTTGNYVASVSNGNYITGGSAGSEGAALTIGVDATSDNTASKVVARDANGSFSANVVLADLTGDVTGTVSDISNHDTGDLAEGTNLYFTAARARGNISVSGDLSYNSSTGVISFTERTDAEVRGLASGGTGIDYNSTTGVISVDSTIATKDYANTAASNAVSAVIDAAPGTLDTLNELAAALGDDANFSTTVTNSIATKLATADFNSTADTWLSGKDTGDLAEGTNLYFTAARARGNISVSGDLSYNSSTGVISFTERTDAEVRGLLSGGTGISYNSTTGVISLTDTGYVTGVTAGTGLSGGGTDGTVTLSLGTSGVTAGVFGSASAVPQLTVDAYGRVTAGSNVSIAISSGQVSGLATSATTDTTNASNISSGTLASARLPDLTVADFAAAAIQTGAESFSDSDSVLMTAAAVQDKILSYGYTTNVGDITGVTAGSYLTGGGASGSVTLNVDATTTATANKVAARDASGDLYAAIFQGTASSARYADLAERYEADAILEPGTVVCFGGEKEITACDHENDHAVAGVVSTDPAYMMNSAAGNNDTHPYIALTGRVPVKVVGPVAKGDLLVASGVKGHAMANNDAKAGTIIGKAIGSSDAGEGVVEALITLM